MRLLNTETKQFQEFFDSQIPPYCILSHRSEGDEVSFKEFRQGEKQSSLGHVKIMKCCDVVSKTYYFDWVWIDTICINKSSSAELTEAINSMYSWYSNAGLCIVYLSDVYFTEESWFIQFKKSLWFTRGWTLQELLAPRCICFLDSRWSYIGTKETLSEEISSATTIEIRYLLESSQVHKASVAKRMSWAADRKTSRKEDIAYCLLGIFNVNMPLIYGEGDKAFSRLQLEIINSSDDELIFAWGYSRYFISGMLAPSPEGFATSGSIDRSESLRRPPYTMTNKGLQMQVPASIIPRVREIPTLYNSNATILIPIDCCPEGHDSFLFTIQLVPHEVQLENVRTSLSLEKP